MEKNAKSIPDLDIIDRYLSGELIDEDSQAAKRYFENNPKVEAAMRRRGSVPFSVEKKETDGLVHTEIDTSWKEMLRSIAESKDKDWFGIFSTIGLAVGDNRKYLNDGNRIQETAVPGGEELKHVRSKWRYYSYFNIAIVLILIGLGQHQYSSGLLKNTSVVYHAGELQEADVMLIDGSKVVLGGGASLEVTGKFGEKERSVKLSGAGYFKVGHHKSGVFSVQTQNWTAQVLGTEFAVTSYSPGNIAVYVKSGKVSVGKNIVQPRERLAIDADSSWNIVRADEDEELGFTFGRLIVVDKPLKYILPMIEHYYKVKIQLEDERIGSMKIDIDQKYGSLVDIIELLETTLNVRAEVSGQKIKLYMN